MIDQLRPTQRRTLKTLDDEESLTTDIINLAVRFGRYGYRRITALLRDRGWQGQPHACRAYLATRRAELPPAARSNDAELPGV